MKGKFPIPVEQDKRTDAGSRFLDCRHQLLALQRSGRHPVDHSDADRNRIGVWSDARRDRARCRKWHGASVADVSDPAALIAVGILEFETLGDGRGDRERPPYAIAGAVWSIG